MGVFLLLGVIVLPTMLRETFPDITPQQVEVRIVYPGASPSEIEESISSHANISEVAVVGIEDKLKGQVAIGFAIPKDALNVSTLEAELMKTVDSQLGAVARPARVYIVTALPKTRSGKIVRRALQAVAEGRDPGDISTMEDQSVLAHIKTVIEESAKKS
jgi:propionyl-CoA synthetase